MHKYVRPEFLFQVKYSLHLQLQINLEPSSSLARNLRALSKIFCQLATMAFRVEKKKPVENLRLSRAGDGKDLLRRVWNRRRAQRSSLYSWYVCLLTYCIIKMKKEDIYIYVLFYWNNILFAPVCVFSTRV